MYGRRECVWCDRVLYNRKVYLVNNSMLGRQSKVDHLLWCLACPWFWSKTNYVRPIEMLLHAWVVPVEVWCHFLYQYRLTMVLISCNPHAWVVLSSLLIHHPWPIWSRHLHMTCWWLPLVGRRLFFFLEIQLPFHLSYNTPIFGISLTNL